MTMSHNRPQTTSSLGRGNISGTCSTAYMVLICCSSRNGYNGRYTMLLQMRYTVVRTISCSTVLALRASSITVKNSTCTELS